MKAIVEVMLEEHCPRCATVNERPERLYEPSPGKFITTREIIWCSNCRKVMIPE